MLTAHLAIDFGASSGRAVLGFLEGDPRSLRLEEVHRFEHLPVPTPDGLIWDGALLWQGVLEGLRSGAKVAREAGVELASVGVDTWGVDWSVVDASGELAGFPHAYRDPAHAVARDRVLNRLPGGFDALYARTGTQLQPFNTIFQFEARRDTSLGKLLGDPNARFLMLPDLLHYRLSGVRSNERTNASTTGMLSATTGDWDRELLETLGLPHAALGEIVEPGTVLGPIREEWAEELDLPKSLQVVAPATHDTASAIAAAPAADLAPGSWAYLSSGTWSLLGLELSETCTTPEARDVPITNELGVGNTVRFLRNIAGLWLVQELRRDLEKRGESYGFATLAELAEQSEPLRTLVNPNAEDLANPGGSIDKLQAHARRTGQPVPETAGQLARCCLDSLALCYAETISRIESITSNRIETLVVVGGGVNNRTLNQLTADATGRTLLLGPSEATSIGNLLVQAMGLGQIADLKELREVVARSLPPERIEPNPASADWTEARERYARLVTETS